MTTLPTAKMRIINADNAMEEMLAFAKGLEAAGERPWFEVRWPSPEALDEENAERWQQYQEDTFDAVELIGGVLVTLPPYAVLEAAAAAVKS